jgi:hypothetical protein
VTYRGDWPKQLVSLRQQELVGEQAWAADLTDKELPARVSWNFQGPPPAFFTRMVAPPNKLEAVEAGTKAFHEVQPSGRMTGFNFQGTARGDFEVVLKYRELRGVTTATDWKVPRMETTIFLGDKNGFAHTLAIVHQIKADGSFQVAPSLGTRDPQNKVSWKSSTVAVKRFDGQFKIVRKGDMVYFYHAAPGQSRFQLIDLWQANDADVNGVAVGFRVDDPESSGSGVLEEVSIRARSILPKK